MLILIIYIGKIISFILVHVLSQYFDLVFCWVQILLHFERNSLCRLLSCVMASDSLVISNGNGHDHGKLEPSPQRTYQAVVIATQDMGISKDGKLPWNLPTDLKFFEEITTRTSDPGKKNAVVMGRKSWESIPPEKRPLCGRLNVVLTRSGSFDIATAENYVICG